MDLEDRVATLETEFKIIKGEIKALLLDMRETVNDMENPFRSPGPALGNMGAVKGELAEPRKLPALEKALVKEIPAEEEEEEEEEVFFEEANESDERVETEEFFDEGKMLFEEETLPKFKKFEVKSFTPENEEVPKKQDKDQEKIKEKPQEKPREKPQEKPEEIPRISMEKGIDTYTLVELMRWTDYTLSTIGRKRLEEVLNLYALTGHLSNKARDVILNIAKLSTSDVAEDDKATMKDNITVIAQLNEILNPAESGQKEQAIYERSPRTRISKASELSLN